MVINQYYNLLITIIKLNENIIYIQVQDNHFQ